MSNLFGRREEVFGASYDKGHFICHGAGGGGDWNLFPQFRSLNLGWIEVGKLYRRMEAYVAANEGTMFFHRLIYLDGSLCPMLLEYGVLVEHFHTTVAAKLGGKAKAVIVTSSRLHSVRYKLAVGAYLKKLGNPSKALVASPMW